MKPIVSILLGLVLFLSCQSNTKEQANEGTAPTGTEAPKAVGKSAPDGAEPANRSRRSRTKTVQDQFIQRYTGHIGEYPITLVLVNWANGQLEGWYSYDSQQKRIELSGEIQLDESFVLKEYSEDGETGSFSGSMANTDQLSGKWTSKDGAKVLDYQVDRLVVAKFRKGNWTGDWFFDNPWDASTLLMYASSDSTIDFAFNIVRNAHVGILSGIAKRTENKATFKEVLSGDEACEIEFELKPNGIEVFQKSSPSECEMGMRAYASGLYVANSREVKASLSYGKDEVFETKEQHDAFKSWLRSKQYENVAFNMKVFGKEKFQDKKNKISGTVVTGGVPGMYTTNEAVIVYDKDNRFWVASMDQNDYGKTVIHYYTNVESMKKTLPEPIALWRNPYEDYLILFPR